jgi:hypothetical protein
MECVKCVMHATQWRLNKKKLTPNQISNSIDDYNQGGKQVLLVDVAKGDFS